MFSYYIIDLQQECPTYSPRAQSGPPGISIRPARLPRNVKNDRFVSIRWCFSSSKIRQARTPPQIPVGELTTLPRPRSRLGRETPLPIPFPLDAFVISIWPMTSLKFVHLALWSKRLDTPDLQCCANVLIIWQFQPLRRYLEVITQLFSYRLLYHTRASTDVDRGIDIGADMKTAMS